MPEESLNLTNTIGHSIHSRKPVNNKIPILDIMTELTTDEILNTCLYIKPFHSRHIIPWSSNTTMKQKIEVIKSERLRALRLSSNKEMEAISINIVKEKFLINDYPNKYLKKYVLENNRKKIDRNNKPIDSVIKLPFINENISKKTQNI